MSKKTVVKYIVLHQSFMYVALLSLPRNVFNISSKYACFLSTYSATKVLKKIA